MAAGVRIWELGVGSKGGCGCAKRGAASRLAGLEIFRGFCVPKETIPGLGPAVSPDAWLLPHRDFGIHALTGGRRNHHPGEAGINSGNRRRGAKKGAPGR